MGLDFPTNLLISGQSSSKTFLAKTKDNESNSVFSSKIVSKRNINDFLAKKFSYLHIGLVQVAVKPLTRKGINASVLMCLRDARFKNFSNSILGMITASLYDGPVYFDCYPGISLALDDPNIVKALTLKVITLILNKNYYC